MTPAFYRHPLLLALLATTIMGSTGAHAFDSSDEFSSAGDTFANSAEVSDDELATMRGGFISMNGLTIDFALSTRTIIDGVTQSDILISSNNIDDLTTESLKQIVQVGEGNNVEALNQLSQNPTILVLVQNTVDNKVIQNLNVLDIAVANVQEFEYNSLTSMVDLGLVSAIK